MAGKSILIKLDENLVTSLERYAREDERSRAALIREALAAYVDARHGRSIAAQYRDAYAAEPDAEDAHLTEATRRMILEEPW